MKKKGWWKMSSPGFTLLELISAVAIVGTLTAIAVPLTKDHLYKAEVARAIAEIRVMEKEIISFAIGGDRYPNTLTEVDRDGFLDPWGNQYQYLNIADVIKGNGGGHPKGARKDKHEVPLNNDYDLYSMGKDGKSKVPLQNPFSHDDIIRASDGEYVGLAWKY
jgi:general secretion pathway protein G